MSDLTIVTGLWNIGRDGRPFDHYIDKLNELLTIPCNLFIYIPQEYEHLVWAKRDKSNTQTRVYELEDVKRLYSPFWDKTQEIRNNPEWFNMTGEGGWLKTSPQALLEYYNPIVQSKMFMMHDVTIWNPFSSKYFLWLDAGLTNTVHQGILCDPKFIENITKHINPFLFVSYPYEANDEIHGFKFAEMNEYAGQKVTYVCRGGMFGGTKEAISEANSLYYSLLERTLSRGLMGTEESIFTIMSYLEPDKYRRFALKEENWGLIAPFVEKVIEDDVVITGTPVKIPERYDKNNIKTAIYFLTFNYPKQIEKTLEILSEQGEWLETKYKYVFDNSTNEDARIANRAVCDKYGFEHIITGENKGICGGRQLVAEHFDTIDADYYIFFEDDMTLNGKDLSGRLCRNGLSRYVGNLWDAIHNIMMKEKYDYLKLTFTEVYMDNHLQVSWYNVPQDVRTANWPDYDKLPITGLDYNAPRVKYNKIDVFDGVLYAEGQVYYANWPLIFSKEGNKKVFLTTKWAHPFEQTMMSYVFQEQLKGNIKAAVLLASPITHDRFQHYDKEERKES